MADDSTEYMLTTVDNPWSPFTNYDEWYEWDANAGYATPGLLARIANITLELSENDLQFQISEAMKEIVRVNASGMHRLVAPPTSK